MKTFLALTLAAILSSPVFAQESAPCAPRESIVTQLESKYGETRRGAGLQNRGAVTEVFANLETGTWTILVTRPDGVSCAVAAGEAWTETSEVPTEGDGI